EAGVAFEGECGGRRLECDGEARGSASEQKERRGNRKINANAFAMPYASGRNRCVGVEGRPFRLAVEAGDDVRILAVDDAYDPAVANLQRSERIGRQLAGVRLGWIGLDHSAGGVHRAGDAAARGNGRCKQPVRAPLDPERGPDEMGCLEHDVATQGCKGGKVDLDAFGLHHWRRVRLGPFRKRHVGQYGAEFRPHLDLRRGVYVHPEAAPGAHLPGNAITHDARRRKIGKHGKGQRGDNQHYADCPDCTPDPRRGPFASSRSCSADLARKGVAGDNAFSSLCGPAMANAHIRLPGIAAICFSGSAQLKEETMSNETPLWIPSRDRVASAPLTAFAKAAADLNGGSFKSYSDLHRWSVENRAAFWSLVWDFCGVV